MTKIIGFSSEINDGKFHGGNWNYNNFIFTSSTSDRTKNMICEWKKKKKAANNIQRSRKKFQWKCRLHKCDCR